MDATLPPGPHPPRPSLHDAGQAGRWGRLRGPRGGLAAVSLGGALLVAHAASTWAAHEPAWPSGPDLDTLVALGARADPQLAAGEYGRLATAVFLHDGLPHAAMNALWTVLLVLLLARLGVSVVGAVAGWVLGGVVAMAASWAWAPGVTVGASGAVFALLGWLAVALARRLPRGRRALPVGLVFVALAAPSAAGAVDIAAHAGGALAGFALGLLPARWVTGRAAPVGVAAAAVLGVAVGLRVVHAGSPGSLVPSGGARDEATWLRPCRRTPGIWLPRLGTPGAWRPGGRVGGSGCVAGALPGPGELDCQQLAGGFLAVCGPWERLRAASPEVPAQLPAGRCAWTTEGGQTAVIVRGGAGDRSLGAPALVFATLSSQWEGYAPLWRALTAGRCPGIGARGSAPRRGPRGSGRRRRGRLPGGP